MYSFPSLEPVSSMSGSNCCLLTCTQVSQETSKMIWYSQLFKNFPQFVVIHTVKVFRGVNEAEIDVFLELSCFLYDPLNVGNLISGSSAFSKPSSYICKFSVHLLLKPSLKDFEQNLDSSLSILWHSPSSGLEWKLIFSSSVATAEFSKFSDVMSEAIEQYHLLGFEITQLEFHHLH